MPKAKVLVVEDEPVIARDIQRTLERFGFTVPATVSSGEEAVQKVAEVRPDLALVDIALAGEMDGVEVARRLRFDFDVPVIYLTAHADEALRKRAKPTEPLGYVVKPFEEQALLAAIEVAVHQCKTTRERSEAALRKREAQFRAVFEVAAIGIALVDPKGRLLEANRALGELLGYRVEGLRGKAFAEFIHPDDVAQDHRLFEELVAGGRDHYQIELRHIRQDGGVVWGRLTVSAVRDTEPSIQFAVRMVEDITQRVKAQRASRRRMEQLALLYATSLDSVNSNDWRSLLHIVVERAVQALAADRGAAYLRDRDGQEMRCIASYDNAAHDRTGAMQASEAEDTTANAKPLITNDYRAWPGNAAIFEAGQPLTAMLSAPLTYQNQTIGVIHVLHERGGQQFSQDDLELLTLFANQAAMAVANGWLVEADREQRRLIEALHQVGQDLTSDMDLDSLLHAIVSQAVAVLGGVSGGLYLHRPGHDVLEWAVSVGPNLPPIGSILHRGEGLSGKVWEVGTPLFRESAAPPAGRRASARPYHIGAVVGAPVRWGERLLGVLNVRADPPRVFSQSDAEVLSLFATQAAVALENARGQTEIQKLTITDPLTGLYNRHGFIELGRREIERARRDGTPLVAMMFDLDHLKQVNDTFGHHVGDQALAGLAAACSRKLRGVDLLGRYGGEEFAALLPGTSVADGRRVAERLRQYIEETPVLTDRGPLAVTISLGVAALDAAGDDLEILLRRASHALDTAKRAGRNQVYVYE